jgi:hypothetical protein
LDAGMDVRLAEAGLWWSADVSAEPTAPQGLAAEVELAVLRASAS